LGTGNSWSTGWTAGFSSVRTTSCAMMILPFCAAAGTSRGRSVVVGWSQPVEAAGSADNAMSSGNTGIRFSGKPAAWQMAARTAPVGLATSMVTSSAAPGADPRKRPAQFP
jgi:hypothetical protein